MCHQSPRHCLRRQAVVPVFPWELSSSSSEQAAAEALPLLLLLQIQIRCWPLLPGPPPRSILPLVRLPLRWAEACGRRSWAGVLIFARILEQEQAQAYCRHRYHRPKESAILTGIDEHCRDECYVSRYALPWHYARLTKISCCSKYEG